LISAPQGIDLDSSQLGLRIWPLAERPSSVIGQTISQRLHHREARASTMFSLRHPSSKAN